LSLTINRHPDKLQRVTKTLLANWEQFLERAVELAPTDKMVRYNLGATLLTSGFSERAIIEFDEAVTLDAEFQQARFAACMVHIPKAYRQEKELTQARENYTRRLSELITYFEQSDPARRRAAAEIVGFSTPYFLAYQGCDDRALQAQYGQLIYSLMAEAYPEFSNVLTMPPHSVNEPLRTGVLSAHFREH